MRRRLMPRKINLSSEPESGNLRPGERFRNHIRNLTADPVLSVQPSAGSDPFVSSGIQYPVAIHHLSPGLRKGRRTELHPAGYGLAVPRRSLAAAVFFPDTQPGEIRALPDVAEGLPELWRESDEVRMVALWVSEMGCIAAGGRGLLDRVQGRLPTSSAARELASKILSPRAVTTAPLD